MRILLVSPVVGDAYGQERVLNESIRLLQSRSHEVLVLTDQVVGSAPTANHLVAIPGLTLMHTLPAKAHAKILKQLIHEIEALNVDIVHLVEQFDPALMTYFAENFPLVMTAHTVAPTCPASHRMVQGGGYCTRVSGWSCALTHYSQQCLKDFPGIPHRLKAIGQHLNRTAILKKHAHMIANSDYIRRALVLDGWDPKRISVVTNPIASVQRITDLKNPIPNHFVVASRLVPMKGVEVLIKALDRIKSLPWTVSICGDGELSHSLKSLVQQRGLQSQINFMGRLNYEKVQTLIAHSTALIQPNLGVESFGMAVAEALALGVPVVCSDLPALNELVSHQVQGLLTQAGNPDSLAQAIRRLIEEPGLRDQLANEAAKFTAEAFQQKHLEATLEVYQKLVHYPLGDVKRTEFRKVAST